MRSLVDTLNTSLTDPKQVEDVANIVFDQVPQLGMDDSCKLNVATFMY